MFQEMNTKVFKVLSKKQKNLLIITHTFRESYAVELS